MVCHIFFLFLYLFFLGITKKLHQRNIPVNDNITSVLYDQEEIQLILTFFSVLMNPNESKYLYNFICSSIYSFPPFDLGKITEIQMKYSISLKELLTIISDKSLMDQENVKINKTIKNIYQLLLKIEISGNWKNFLFFIQFFIDEAISKSKKIIEDLAYFENFIKTHTISQLVYEFLKRNKLLDYYLHSTTISDQQKASNIAKFLTLISNIENSINSAKLSDVISQIQAIEQSDYISCIFLLHIFFIKYLIIKRWWRYFWNKRFYIYFNYSQSKK